MVYAKGLSKEQDALMELLDALIERTHAGSPAELSLTASFRREWESIYKAVERGKVDEKAMSQLFVKQMPHSGVQVLPLDSTIWAHPAARTLAELVYAVSPTKALKRHSIVQGHEYSLLGWNAERRTSWTPTLTIQRVAATGSSIDVGVEQVRWFCQQRQESHATALDVVVADGHYGNPGFFAPLRTQSCALLARFRRDRVLYGAPGPYKGKGRPAKHGAAFAFKDPTTWGKPVEQCEFIDERWGEVRLRRWDHLHDKQDAQTTLSVICAEVHCQRETPPAPLWLGYKPGHTDFPVREVWSWFERRWPIEPSIRFRKQHLFWTLPAFQRSEICDRWTWLNQTAFWFLFLARPLVADCHLPWQKPVVTRTPERVKRAFPSLFAAIGTPASPPKTRGKSPGWTPNRLRTRKTRHSPLKRGKSRPTFHSSA